MDTTMTSDADYGIVSLLIKGTKINVLIPKEPVFKLTSVGSLPA